MLRIGEHDFIRAAIRVIFAVLVAITRMLMIDSIKIVRGTCSARQVNSAYPISQD
ncbi:hypothetical protein [Anaplasma phagocytophilum]|uniref:hypothetical protein n=1 Tax=Anaplasma phagocytophilum TaxID=948 RepID=UPI00201A680F